MVDRYIELILMNRELYDFLKKFREPDGYLQDLCNCCDFNSLPDKSGAYIFLSQEQKFVYPNGKSSVIYIGMSNKLDFRIKKHHSHLCELKKLSKKEILQYWYYSRYHYINQFRCQVFWFTTRGTQEAKNLECILIGQFYDKYLSLPIGNGAFSYYK